MYLESQNLINNMAYKWNFQSKKYIKYFVNFFFLKMPMILDVHI